MDKLIERYVYDVVRRLPEKERDEVSKELMSNIYDMLAENPNENEIKMVLYELGQPALLAEKYRQKPRYLISPAIYDDYIRALKLILPLVGGIVFVVGSLLGGIEAIKDGMSDISFFIKNIISNGISMGVSAIFQALMWTTLGFIIAERTGAKTNEQKKHGWEIEDLPEVLPNDKGVIPLSNSIVELVLTIVFSFFAVLACKGMLPLVLMIQNTETKILSFFSSGFLASCVPAIIAMAFLTICECIIKIKERRWTPLVCGMTIISSLTSISILIYLTSRPDIFSTEFSTFLQAIGPDSDLRRLIDVSINPAIIIFTFIIIVASLAECGKAIYKTFICKRY